MAIVPSNTQACYHNRSNSLLSRAHPLTSEIDEHLRRLRASEATSTPSSINHSLNGIQDLHECVHELLQLPLTQQSLAQEQQRKCVEKLLDGSFRLLELCSTAKYALSQTEECTQELQSVSRRRGGAEMRLVNDVTKYIKLRKVVKKAIHKALTSLKQNSSWNKDSEMETIFGTLQEVQAATMTELETLLSFISEQEAEPKFSPAAGH